VGVDDDIIRRVSGRVEFSVPEGSRQELGGIESGSLEFTVEFTKVNGDQEIEAPSDARPLSDLTTSLGGGRALPGLGGGAPEAPEQTPAPETGTPAAPEGEDFREYADCLDKARPEDTEALQRCADLLDRP
jgi:hypothetical protein